jgi:hypothetical protein
MRSPGAAVSPTPLGQAAILEYGQVHRTEGNGDFSKSCHLGPDIGDSLGNRVFADGIKGLGMGSYWTHSIGPGRHIGIWPTCIELRGMVTFPKLCHLGPEWGLTGK